MVSPIIEQTLTRLCPIAAMFAECGEVTAEHRIIRNGSGWQHTSDAQDPGFTFRMLFILLLPWSE